MWLSNSCSEFICFFFFWLFLYDIQCVYTIFTIRLFGLMRWFFVLCVYWLMLSSAFSIWKCNFLLGKLVVVDERARLCENGCMLSTFAIVQYSPYTHIINENIYRTYSYRINLGSWKTLTSMQYVWVVYVSFSACLCFLWVSLRLHNGQVHGIMCAFLFALIFLNSLFVVVPVQSQNWFCFMCSKCLDGLVNGIKFPPKLRATKDRLPDKNTVW